MRWFAIAFIVFILCCEKSVGKDPCKGGEPYIHVSTARHRLWLCEAGIGKRSYRVRLGKGGIGKKEEGDGKTPLGKYDLDEPRPSEIAGTFIPIKYPTKKQKEQGYTGASVGIHGPYRCWTWFGPFVDMFDNTDGCVRLATDKEMAEITDWLSRTGATTVVIR